MSVNKHGVEGITSTSGNLGHVVDGQWRSNLPVFVPRCCVECEHYCPGEMGEMGSRLTGPYCERNLFLPTRTGTCKRQVRRGKS